MASEKQLFNLQRRKFFEMVSKAGVTSALWRASPFVGALMASRFAEAQGTAPKRFVALYTPGGAPPGSWMPSSISNMNRATISYGDLDVAKYCNFHLVNCIGGDHGAAHAVLNVGSGSSFDQQLARILSANTPYSSINLGYQASITTSDTIGRSGNQSVIPEDSAERALTQYFGAPPPGGAAEALYNRQAAILDANREALKILESKIASASEKVRLETHLAAIEKLDARLSKAAEFVPLPGCSSPTMPSSGGSDDGGGALTEMNIRSEIAVTAMACGLSNVATLQMSNSQCDWRYNGKFSESHHQTAHGRGYDDTVTVTEYVNRAASHCIKTLVDTEDPVTGGKMIDSTVFLYVTEQEGMSHMTTSCPNILATNISGFDKGTVGRSVGSNRDLMADVAEGLGLGGQIAQGGMTDIRKSSKLPA